MFDNPLLDARSLKQETTARGVCSAPVEHFKLRLGRLTSGYRFLGCRRCCFCNIGQRFTDFYLSILNANLQTGLRMNSRSIQHPTVFQREARFMPWAHNTVADQFAFRQRPAEMRAGLCQRKDPISTANQQGLARHRVRRGSA